MIIPFNKKSALTIYCIIDKTNKEVQNYVKHNNNKKRKQQPRSKRLHWMGK